ncbi:hypothetical protein SFRURICE_011661 [Spodoptera frugiperda]|nr:hypothetical protein SFRURICE_011661 [Spodoptera frugiperda]
MTLNLDVIKILIWYIIVLQITQVLGQICVETKLSYRDVPETYTYTYMEAYEKSDCLFWCTDTRVATAVGTRIVRKLMPEQVHVCCEGYIRKDDNNETSINCEPYCSPPCVNGYCKSPGVCACNAGYLPDMFASHNCSPLCIRPCDHGMCVAPNTCECDEGYNLVNEVCEPICSKPCHNGTCVAPQTCQCLPGYKKFENDTCEPFCSNNNETGDCINSVICEPGWSKVMRNSIEICEPTCTSPCNNGTCVAPDICECFEGYEKTGDDTCMPHCSWCVHGTCIGPQICLCDPGWYKKELNGNCLPHCDYKCGNGTCVAPNTCECLPGYKVDEKATKLGEDSALCAPECKHCDGTCIAPGTCVCEPPEHEVLVTIDGQPCQCVDNCSDTAHTCERTICLLTTTVSSVTKINADQTSETKVTDIYTSTLRSTDIEIAEVTTDQTTDWEQNQLMISETP